MPPRLFPCTALAMVFGIGTFILAACNSGTGPGDTAKNVKVQIEMEYEIGILRDSASDSVGLGFTFGTPLFPVHSDEDARLRKDGVYLFAFPDHKPDSVDVFYYLAGSKAAWAPYVSLQDSLRAGLADSAANARYLDADVLHTNDYFVEESIHQSACSLSAPDGTARIQSGDVAVDVPIVIASIDRISGGHLLTIDQEASRPPGAASVNLLGKTYQGTLILTCAVSL